MDNQKQSLGYNRNMLLFIIILTSLINPFLSASVNIALPKIGEEFSIHAVTMSWVSMSFLLSSAVFLVPMGKIADIVGRKKIFLYGNIIVTIASFLCAVSTSAAMLIFFRILQGIGSSMMFSTGIAIITSAFPLHERGKAIGISVSSVYFSLSLAPFLGGILTQAFGWRSLFLVTLPIGLFVIIATLVYIKTDWAEAKNEKFDLPGSLIYVVAVSAFMYGFSQIPGIYSIILAVLGIIGLIIFIKIELRSAFPVLNIRLFMNNRVFAFSNLAALINYSATFALTFVLSLYLQYIKGFSPREAGTLLVVQPLLMTILASYSGKLSDKFNSGTLSSLGMGITVIGLFLLIFLKENTASIYIICSLAILGIGFGLFSAPNTNAIMSSVEKKYFGIASATVSTMRLTGQMMSMGIATFIIHICIGEQKIIPANYSFFLNGVKIIFILFSLLCLLGIFASLSREKKITKI